LMLVLAGKPLRLAHGPQPHDRGRLRLLRGAFSRTSERCEVLFCRLQAGSLAAQEEAPQGLKTALSNAGATFVTHRNAPALRLIARREV
jgi:hypothetical protein